MSTRMYRETTCERCGKKESFDVTEAMDYKLFPEGWSTFGINEPNREGWYGDLCPDCFASLEFFLKGKPKAEHIHKCMNGLEHDVNRLCDCKCGAIGTSVGWRE